jgi:hypothetical protein
MLRHSSDGFADQARIGWAVRNQLPPFFFDPEAQTNTVQLRSFLHLCVQDTGHE